MKNFDVKIFESNINDEAFNRAKEQLNRNVNFEINDDNITEFVDCKLVLDILKEYKIEYRIIVEDRWNTIGRIPQYDLMVCIYISQEDYDLIKYLLEPEEELESEEFDAENDKITKNINLTYNILINLISFAIGIPFFILGIQLIAEDITAVILIIIGGTIVIFRLVKIIKLIINKFAKRKK